MDLTKFDNEILEVKYSFKKGVRQVFFSKLKADVQKAEAILLIAKISFITGWVIPKDYMFDIAVEQLTLKICEDYENLNVDEIVFAFRKFGTSVKDWGRDFNLNLFDQVLPLYLSERQRVSSLEERLNSKPIEPKIYAKEDLDNDARKDAYFFYKRLLKGSKEDVPTNVYSILKSDFNLKDSEVIKFIVERVNSKINFYEK